MSRVRNLLDMMEATKSKAGLTLRTLITNAQKVLGRVHYQDRNVKIVKVTPTIGMKSIRIDAEVYGSKLYQATIIFYKVEFSDTKDQYHPLAVRVKEQTHPIYSELLNPNKHPVRVSCACPWFMFAAEWWLAKAGALLPAKKPRKYSKVPGSTRPSVNPEKIPCVCLSGDTKIPLMSGEILPIKDLVGKSNFYVYSYDFNTNKIIPARVRNCRKTGSNIDVVKITLDDGSSFKCTYNHKILLRNSRYIEAKDLNIGDSLMPLYRQIDEKGYQQLKQPNGDWEYTHRITYNWKYGNIKKLPSCHHKSFNKSNNSPDKLLAVEPKMHIRYHGHCIDKVNDMLNNPDNPNYSEERRSRWIKNLRIAVRLNVENGVHHFITNNPIYNDENKKAAHTARDRKNQLLLSKGEHYFQSDDHVNRLLKLSAEGKHPFQLKTEESYESGVKRRIITSVYKILSSGSDVNENSYKQYKLDNSPKWCNIFNYFNNINEIIEEANYYNHKIISIECSESEDVYDFEVDTTHNFAIEAGVFVHNCKHIYQVALELQKRGLMIKEV